MADEPHPFTAAIDAIGDNLQTLLDAAEAISDPEDLCIFDLEEKRRLAEIAIHQINATARNLLLMAEYERAVAVHEAVEAAQPDDDVQEKIH